MNRREFFNKSSILGLAALGGGLTTLSRTATAQEVQEEILISADISRNHGHNLKLSAAKALQLLRSSLETGPESINIQGQSGHPHQIQLKGKDLLELFIHGATTITSSEDFGHNHEVTITLEV